MTRLLLTNQYCYVQQANSEILRRLNSVTSYLVEGFYFTPAYKERRWDGSEKLLTFSRNDGYKFPIGLLDDVIALFDEKFLSYDVVDKRTCSFDEIEYSWNDEIGLRDYQREAVDSVLTNDVFHGIGILKMPPRSGKTRIAARIIYELKRKTLFVVPSQLLLHQTRKVLKTIFKTEIGIIGNSEWDLKDITVATVQSLLYAHDNKEKEFDEIKNGFDTLIVDEIHHLTGKSWKDTVMDLNCRYRIGLSATIFFNNRKESGKGVIWTRAACGNIRYERSMSWMVDHGYLVKPIIEIHKITEPDLTKIPWSKEMQSEAVYENPYRNNLIIEIAKKYIAKNLSILIVSNRVKQVRALDRLCKKIGIKYDVVIGTTANATRQKRIKRFANRESQVLIGTVFGEGVDIPEIDVVINAEGGRGVVSTIQRLRNLTPHEDKKRAIFVEFADLTNGYLAEHSRKRINEYRKESSFDFRIVKS